MTKRDILSLALTITGIVILVHAIIGLPSVIYTVHMYFTGEITGLVNPQWAAATTVAHSLLAILAACFLISWSTELSKRLMPADSEANITQLKGNEPAILSLAFKIFGVIVVAQAIPVLVQNAMSIVLGAYKVNNNSLTNLFITATGGAWVREWSMVVGQVIAIIIGVLLVSATAQISAYILRNRTGV